MAKKAKRSLKTKAPKPAAKKASKAKKPAQKSAAKKSAIKKSAAAKTGKLSKKASQKAAPQKSRPSQQKAAPKSAASKTSAKPVAFVSPLDDRVLIFRMSVSDKTPGGLYIPDSVMERPNKGKVLAVGRGHFSKKGVMRPLDVQVGDAVLFGSYAGQTVEYNSQEYILLREDEILGVVED